MEGQACGPKERGPLDSCSWAGWSDRRPASGTGRDRPRTGEPGSWKGRGQVERWEHALEVMVEKTSKLLQPGYAVHRDDSDAVRASFTFYLISMACGEAVTLKLPAPSYQ